MEMVNKKPYFIHKTKPCRDSQYKEGWFCVTGNIVTFSVDLNRCVKAHLKKINK